jgi:cell shape-determining protein MreC
MIHQFQDKRQIATRKRIIKIIIFLSILLILSVLGLFTAFGKLFSYIGRPIWEIKKTAIEFINSESYLIHSKSSIFTENENLLRENYDLKSLMIDYQILKDENIKLKELMGRIGTKNNLILASILAKPNISPYDTIIVDVGSDIGIREGNKVYTNGNTPIGNVSKVYSNTSLITLYSNPGQITEAMLSGSNISVQLLGRGGGNFEMIIPNDLPSPKGTMVILPYIRSEIIAIIDEIISSPTDPVKKIILRSPINIEELRWVEIKND